MPNQEPASGNAVSDRFSIYFPSGHLRTVDQIAAVSGGLSRAATLRLLVSEALAGRDPGRRAEVTGRGDATTRFSFALTVKDRNDVEALALRSGLDRNDCVRALVGEALAARGQRSVPRGEKTTRTG